MRKTLLATTAAASLLAFGVAAQDTPAADTTAPITGAPAEVVPAVPGTDHGSDAAAKSAPADAATPQTETAQEPMMAPADPAVTDAGPVLTPVEVGEISADSLIGATITTMNGENIATVEDVLVTPDGAVENVVAQFGGFLGFGSNSVLLTLDEIEVMKDEGGAFVVQTALTPESLEGRPDYQAEN